MKNAFTLVEILLMLGILAVMLAVAYPTYIRSRELNYALECQGNLKELSNSKVRWALENKIESTTATPTWDDVTGPKRFMKVKPVCPSGGTYTIGSKDQPPTCSIGHNDKKPDLSHELLVK